MSDVWKGAAEVRSYLRAAIVMPTCRHNHIQARYRPFSSSSLVIKAHKVK